MPPPHWDPLNLNFKDEIGLNKLAKAVLFLAAVCDRL